MFLTTELRKKLGFGFYTPAVEDISFTIWWCFTVMLQKKWAYYRIPLDESNKTLYFTWVLWISTMSSESLSRRTYQQEVHEKVVQVDK